MRSLLTGVFATGLLSCVGSPPVPCTTCGDSCVDEQTDSKNCGACGKVCAGGTTCSAGACVATCNSAQKLCSNACTDVRVDPSNCGDCNHACASGQVCSMGSCSASCASGYSVCQGDAGTYCADLTQSPTDCNACGHACGPAEACVMSQCTSQCGTGRTLCTPTAGAPFCTDPNTDVNNCGACNQPCAAGLSCNSGHCDALCSAPLTSCANAAGMPAHFCANTQNDALNCGACAAACPPASMCLTGRCVPALAESCEQLHALFPGLGDGEVTLYIHSKSYLPYRAYCADMDGGSTIGSVSGSKVFYPDAGPVLDGGFFVFTNDSGIITQGTELGPKTYLTLPQQAPGQNDSEYNNSGFGGFPPRMINQWSRVRFDPPFLKIATNDWRFATTHAIAGNYPNNLLELGTAAGCDGANSHGNANIDLRGTLFSIDPGNTWSEGISAPPGDVGSAVLSVNNEVANVTGGGSCGEYNLDANALGARRLGLQVRGQSCAEILQAHPGTPSGVFSMVDGAAFDGGVQLPPLMYCDMTNISGGWTLVLKVDGLRADSQFFYDNLLWTNEATLNAGAVDLSHQEAKYETFMATPFTQIYIITADANGQNQQSNLLSFPAQSSLVAALQGGFVATSTPLGQAGWTTLLFGTPKTLQPNCNQEGLNNPLVRIGVVGNNEADCLTPDSYAGIGGEVLRLPGSCSIPLDAGFRGFSAGAWGGGTCGGGSADAGTFAYVYVR